MKGMILAAGFGTRLWPLTDQCSKPAMPFQNRPLISYSAGWLASFGVRDIMVNLHHHPESVREALGDGSRYGVAISYSHEPEILGTSGALDRVRAWFSQDDFVVVNGKIVTNIDLSAAVRMHRERSALATLILRQNEERERFSTVVVDGDLRIVRFGGFPGPDDVSPLMFTGIQVLSPRIFDYIPRDRFSHTTTDVYPQAIEAGEKVLAHITSGDWYEMSTIDRYLTASVAFQKKEDKRYVEGPGCSVSDTAVVEDSVLWKRVLIAEGARLRRVVVGDDVRIPAGFSAENAAIVRRQDVRQIERGEIVGENLVVPL